MTTDGDWQCDDGCEDASLVDGSTAVAVADVDSSVAANYDVQQGVWEDAHSDGCSS